MNKLLNLGKAFIGFCFLICFSSKIYSQTISTNAAFISISSNTYISLDTLNNDINSTINNSGSLALMSVQNAGILQGGGVYYFSKNFYNTGTFTANTATVNFNGSIAQTVPSGAFANKLLYNMVISNTNISGVTLADTIGILNSLSFGNVNNSILNSSGFLVIKSFAGNTGLIADATNNGVNTGNTINGNVIVERFIPANNLRGYRFLASSVNSSSSIHANWQEGATSRTNNPHPGYGTHITGSKTDQHNGFDGTQNGNPSFYRYDLASNNFINLPNTSVLTLHDTTGYLLYFRGDRTINLDLTFANQGSSSTTLRSTGTLVQGSRVI